MKFFSSVHLLCAKSSIRRIPGRINRLFVAITRIADDRYSVNSMGFAPSGEAGRTKYRGAI